MFSQFLANNMETLRRLSAVSLIIALVFVPLYPLQVMAQEAPSDSAEATTDMEETPVEEVTPEPELPVTEIVTGDATAETETVSEVNVNEVETQPSPEA